MRECAGYKIIRAIQIGKSTELVIGHCPEAPQPYVCWYCEHQNDYHTGDYCYSFREAMTVLADRIKRNADFIPMEA